MGGKCKKGGNIYTCDALNDDGTVKWNYIGLTGGPIKGRISTHYSTFKYKEYEKHTKLSEEMWKEKREGNIPELRWKVVANARVRRPNNNRCNLCSKETWYIMNRDEKSVNSRLELGGYCPHRRGYLLSQIKSNSEVLKAKAAAKNWEK